MKKKKKKEQAGPGFEPWNSELQCPACYLYTTLLVILLRIDNMTIMDCPKLVGHSTGGNNVKYFQHVCKGRNFFAVALVVSWQYAVKRISAGLVTRIILDNAMCRVPSYSLNCVLISDYDYCVLYTLFNDYVETRRRTVHAWRWVLITCDQIGK